MEMLSVDVNETWFWTDRSIGYRQRADEKQKPSETAAI